MTADCAEIGASSLFLSYLKVAAHERPQRVNLRLPVAAEMRIAHNSRNY